MKVRGPRPPPVATSAAPKPADETPPPTPAPASGLMASFADTIARHVHPVKHGHGLEPARVTHERPFVEAKGFAFGLEFGLTVSELHQVRPKGGMEVVHVVNLDGSSNVELVLGSKSVGAGHRVELQGPALNTSVTPGELPVGARFVGVGLTSDVVDKRSAEAVSYTVEVKATERTAVELATLATPGAATAAAELLGTELAETISEALVAAVPVVGAAIAVSSAYHAIKVVRSHGASLGDKALAVAHAVSDAVRVAFPLVGVLGSAALVGVAAVSAYHKAHSATAPPAPATSAEPAETPP